MCPLCQHKEVKTLYSGLEKVYRVDHFAIQKKLAIKKCDFCQVIFSDPQLTYEELKTYYSADYGAFHVKKRNNFFGKIQNFIKEEILRQFFGYGQKKWWRFALHPFKISLAHYPPKIANGRLLDIGCGAGNFLVNVKKLGYDVYGIDPSPIAVRVAKDQGLKNVYQGILEAGQFEKSFFDIITMFHVFEHIINPRDTISEIKKILKPDGLLIISVPNFSSLGSKIFGKYWAGLSFPLHYFHYHKKYLSLLLESYNFSLVNAYYANLFSDIFVSSPENILNLVNNYQPPPALKKFLALSNLFWGGIDYLAGNSLAHFFKSGSQITVISKNNK